MRIVEGDQSITHDVFRSDCNAVIWISDPLDPLIGEVNRPVFFLRRSRHEHKHRFVGNGLVKDLFTVTGVLRAESGRIVAACADGNHQAVGVCVCCVLEYLVLLGVLVRMHLVGDDDVRIERVLCVRVAGQRVHGYAAAGEIVVGDGMLHVVIQDLPTVFFGLAQAGIQRLRQVVFPAVKRLHRLLEAGGHNVNLRAGHALKHRKSVGQRRNQQRLAVLSWYKNKRLFDDAFLCSSLEENQDGIDDELFPRLKNERLAAQRLSFKRLALPVLKRQLDDADHKIGVFGAHVVCRVFGHPGKALARLPDLDACVDCSVNHALHIASDVRSKLALFKLHELSAPSFSKASASLLPFFSFFGVTLSVCTAPRGVRPSAFM